MLERGLWCSVEEEEEGDEKKREERRGRACGGIDRAKKRIVNACKE